jgi:hypothetical protein
MLKKDNLDSIYDFANHISKEVEQLKIKILAHKKREVSVEEDYREKFPDSQPDLELLSLVGIDPYVSLEDEKKELMNAIQDTYAASEDLG